MTLCPVSFLIQLAMYYVFQLIYCWFQNFFGKTLKTKYLGKGGHYMYMDDGVVMVVEIHSEAGEFQ